MISHYIELGAKQVNFPKQVTTAKFVKELSCHFEFALNLDFVEWS